MKLSPLISVIIPIYNVEPYLERCLDSIQNQTYRNLEIILVDDGSPDNCGKICDERAACDQRIKVIHRKNGGLSAARNSGLDICRGEYIAFVDSDDCIHPEMYGRLYDDICKYQVRLAFCHPNMCYGSIGKITCSQPTVCYGKEYVIKRSMTENIWWSAWTKLYHRSLFEHIRYPEGRTNEDYPITTRIYDQCEQIAVNYNKLYNYCIRGNSICTSRLNPKKFDQVASAQEVLRYMQDRHPDWTAPAEYVLVATILKLLTNVCNEDTAGEFKAQQEELFRLARQFFSRAMRNPYLLKSQKIMLGAARIHPAFFSLANRLYNQLRKYKK